MEEQIQEFENKITRLVSVKNAAETNLRLMENLKQTGNSQEEINRIIESCRRVDDIAKASLSTRNNDIISSVPDIILNEHSHNQNNLATHFLVDAVAAQHGGISNSLQTKLKNILSMPQNKIMQNCLDDTIQENSIQLDSTEEKKNSNQVNNNHNFQQMFQEQQRGRMLNSAQIQQLDKNEEPLEITTTFVQPKEQENQEEKCFPEESTKTNLPNHVETSSNVNQNEKNNKGKNKSCCYVF